MKPATRAPFYATIYHSLCETARKHGYALAIHGTVTTDLDLIAIPWVEDAASADELRAALMRHLGLCGYDDLMRRQGHSEEFIREFMAGDGKTMDESTVKPHGRIAWNLHMDHGAKVDLSVMPRQKKPPQDESPTAVSAP